MLRLSRNLLFAALLLLLPSYFHSATRGIHVVSKKGQPVHLYKDYYALVIGVSDYEVWPDLPNAVKDAKEVSAALKRLGFKVKLVLNPNSVEFRQALNNLTYTEGRETNRALVFYYAGHGATETLADDTKLGYVIPRDCPLLDVNPQGFVNQAVSMKDLEAYSLRIRSKHVLMLFDSCFSGSLFSLVRAIPEDISEKSAFPVRQYITAGREDEQVPDKSMFKRSLLVGLEGDADLTRDGYITGSELGMYLADKVVKYTKGRQHPQYGKINNPDLDRGDFIIVPKDVRRKEQKLAYIPKGENTLSARLRHGAGPFVVDDFEDKDLWSSYWNDRWLRAKKGKAKLKVSVDPTQGANGTSSSMRIKYKLSSKSAVWVLIGGYSIDRAEEVERNTTSAYDLSRFNKISFYVRGKKKKTSHSRPQRIVTLVSCYGEDIKSSGGKYASYISRDKIYPDEEWKKVEITLDSFVPSPHTKKNVSNYAPKPDIHKVLNLFIAFSSFLTDGGGPGSNTVWIDEIVLE